ncbi:MAG TPA: hypothetical protein DCG75_17720 [Bacteroidales bacterium]|nr:hypothetical protein [Bacteroidales bacterium]
MKEKFDAILVRPPEPIIETWYDYAESLGLGYIASYAREQGHSIKIIDAIVEKKTIEEVVTEVLNINPLIVGFSVFQVAFENTIIIAKKLREKGFVGHITLGGHFPTFSAKEILGNYGGDIDSIVTYEGEIPFSQLIESLKKDNCWETINNLIFKRDNKIIQNPINPLITNLDELPLPARDKFFEAFKVNKTISISASRGCWNNCSFCTVTAFYDVPRGSRWRGRSVENIINEIEFLQIKYAYNSFTFIDDNFFGPGTKGVERVIDFAKRLIEKNLNIDYSIECRVDDVDYEIFSLLKNSGLKAVFLGIENGDNNILNRFNKRATVTDNERAIKILESLELSINAGFILYDPFINLSELEKNIEFIKKYKIFDLPALLRKLELRNGMEYRKIIENSGLLIVEKNVTDYYFKDKSVNNFYKLIQLCLSNFIPSYFLFRELKNKKELSLEASSFFSDELNQSAIKIFEDLLQEIRLNQDLMEESKEYIEINNLAKQKGQYLYKTLKFTSLIKN